VAVSTPLGWMFFSEALDEACSKLIDCTLGDDKFPVLPRSEWEAPKRRNQNKSVLAGAEIVALQEMRRFTSRLPFTGSEVCLLRDQRAAFPAFDAAFDPAIDEYVAAKWEIRKLMHAAVVAKELPVFIEENGQVRSLLIDPREWELDSPLLFHLSRFHPHHPDEQCGKCSPRWHRPPPTLPPWRRWKAAPRRRQSGVEHQLERSDGWQRTTSRPLNSFVCRRPRNRTGDGSLRHACGSR
jgi:hypothetical protein